MAQIILTKVSFDSALNFIQIFKELMYDLVLLLKIDLTLFADKDSLCRNHRFQ